MVTANGVLKEITSLLYWSMLAACTVGPGTVVTCARAGAQQGLDLIWALVFATVLAYILQEGSARLTISSGRSLGECLREKYVHLPKLYNVSIICWIVTTCVFVGNTFYECNNWAGGMSAIYILPGAENTDALRIPCCFGFAIVVYGLLYIDKTHHLSVGLGVLLIGMAVLFLVVVCEIGLNWKDFGLGLLPHFPSGSSSLVMGLVGTTSIGFNLFLGSSMAQDASQTMGSVRRGLAFSVCGALTISVLIMIVGAGVDLEDSDAFQIEDLASVIEENIGRVGLWFFGLGFIAAAVSSMLAVPLGAALTADSMFTITKRKSDDEDKAVNDVAKKEATPTSVATGDGPQPLSHEHLVSDDSVVVQEFPRWAYQSLMLVVILISTAVIAANLPTEDIIQIAQVFNGCLLPIFASCLLLCLNDEKFMAKHPQTWYGNVLLVVAVTITLFLAFNVIITNIFGSVLESDAIKFAIAGSLALVTMILLILLTSLRRDLLKSFPCYKPKMISIEPTKA